MKAEKQGPDVLKFVPKQVTPVDPNADPADMPRVAGQSGMILDRLRNGPATTDELAQISRKYTSRISDLRAKGYVIHCLRKEGGNNLYLLIEY